MFCDVTTPDNRDPFRFVGEVRFPARSSYFPHFLFPLPRSLICCPIFNTNNTAGSFRGGTSVRGPTTFILLSFQPCPSPRRCLFFLVFDRRGRISMGGRCSCSSARFLVGRRCSQFPRARWTGAGLRGIAPDLRRGGAAPQQDLRPGEKFVRCPPVFMLYLSF